MARSKDFLLVFAEPNPSISDSDFNDWYNESVTLHLADPTFHSWARFKAVDGQKPAYAAYYDLSSHNAALVALKSTLAKIGDAGVSERFEALDWRTYEVYTGSTPLLEPSELYDPKVTAPYTLFAGVSVREEDEEELNRWFDEEHIPMLSKMPGWVRSRKFVLKDAGKTGGQEGRPPKYLAVHEWTTGPEEREASEEYKAAVSTEWMARVAKTMTAMERRQFGLLRRWDRE